MRRTWTMTIGDKTATLTIEADDAETVADAVSILDIREGEGGGFHETTDTE